jgi:hypothetical protein
MPDSSTSFNTVYIVSVIAALGAVYLVNLNMVSSSSSTVILVKFFIVPLVVAFVTLTFLNMLFPTLNSGGRTAGNFASDTVAETINNMNYMQIFPPIFIVFVMFLVMAFQ